MMKRKISCLLFILIAALSSIYGDFDDTGVGARPLGMGGAYVSLADDVYALYYNPAGLGWLRKTECATEYERLHMGLSDKSTIAGSFIGFVHPLHRYTHTEKKIETSSSAVTGASVETTIIEQKRDLGVMGVSWINFGLVGVYQEHIISLAWGRRFKDRFSWGCAFKLLMQTYEQDGYTRIDPVFDYGSTSAKNAFSVDTGFQYNIGPRLFVGITAMDVNQPDLGFKTTDILPMSLKTGICFREKTLSMLMDVVKKDEDYRCNSGVEKWFFKKAFAVRAGTSIGSREIRDLTAGLSWDLKSSRIDYGIRFPLAGIEDTMGTHRISLVFRFGRTPEDELEPGSIEAELVKLEQEQRELKARLKDAIEMKEKMEQILVEEALARVREKIQAVAVSPTASKSSFAKKTDVIGTHVVGNNETLRSIAERYYGSSKRWLDIYNINKDKVGRGGRVKRGTVLVLPPTEEEAIKVVEKTSEPQVLETSHPSPKPAVIPQKIITPVKPVEVKKEQPAKRKHLVKEGDTLKTLSEYYYKDASRWKDIYNANKDKVKMGRVEPGTELEIP